MIKSFRDKDTEKVFLRERSRSYSTGVQRMALRKLLILDAAESLDELRVPCLLYTSDAADDDTIV